MRAFLALVLIAGGAVVALPDPADARRSARHAPAYAQPRYYQPRYYRPRYYQPRYYYAPPPPYISSERLACEERAQRRHPDAAPRMGACAGRVDDAPSGVEPLERGQRHGPHRPRAVRRPVDGGIVEHHDVAVGGPVDVQPEPIGTRLEAGRECRKGVLGKGARRPPMREQPRTRPVEVARRLLHGLEQAGRE